MTIDGRVIAGLPAAPVSLDEVRSRLLDPATPPEIRDGVWAHLIRRARVDGPSWTVAAAGMAMPMLAGLARGLCVRFEGDPSDIRAELVAGFVAALGTVDPDRHPFVSLRWAAYRSGHAAVVAALNAPRPVAPLTVTDDPRPDRTGSDDDRAGGSTSGVIGPDDADGARVSEAGSGRRSRRPRSGPPPSSTGHPDLVLARAVSDGVLTTAEAALIGSTRLEAVTVAQAAAALGSGASTTWSRRYRAESRLVAYLSDIGPDRHYDTEAPSAPAADRTTARTVGAADQTGTAGRARRRRARRAGPTRNGRVTPPVSGGGVPSSVGRERAAVAR